MTSIVAFGYAFASAAIVAFDVSPSIACAGRRVTLTPPSMISRMMICTGST